MTTSRNQNLLDNFVEACDSVPTKARSHRCLSDVEQMSQPKDPNSPKRPMAAEIAAYLARAIRDQSFRPGTRLPTEDALSRQFGVSRTVVREAISRAKADGLVRSRQGSGLFVAEPFERRSFTVEGSLADDSSRILSFFELRRPIEISAAQLAAARRTDADLASIAAAQQEMATAKDWSKDGVSYDLRFHHAIAIATQNGYYIDFMAFLGNVVADSIRIARAESKQPGVDQITIEEHARILRAIERRDAEAAGLAMHNHLAGASDRMRRP
jgi:GntR family transcriptional repressor for pyruvate dehydrogenase complex